MLFAEAAQVGPYGRAATGNGSSNICRGPSRRPHLHTPNNLFLKLTEAHRGQAATLIHDTRSNDRTSCIWLKYPGSSLDEQSCRPEAPGNATPQGGATIRRSDDHTVLEDISVVPSYPGAGWRPANAEWWPTPAKGGAPGASLLVFAATSVVGNLEFAVARRCENARRMPNAACVSSRRSLVSDVSTLVLRIPPSGSHPSPSRLGCAPGCGDCARRSPLCNRSFLVNGRRTSSDRSFWGSASMSWPTTPHTRSRFRWPSMVKT